MDKKYGKSVLETPKFSVLDVQKMMNDQKDIEADLYLSIFKLEQENKRLKEVIRKFEVA